MTTRNIFLTERGFGNAKHGEATTIAGEDGKGLTLCFKIMPNGSIGGQLTIVPLDIKNKNSKSDINTSETVYEVSVIRNSGLASNGAIRVRTINARDMSVKICQIGFLCVDSDLQLMNGPEAQNPEEANQLLNGILFDCLQAALNRSYDSKPSKLYFGIGASDVAPIKMQWYNKETGESQDTKPVYSQAFLELVKA